MSKVVSQKAASSSTHSSPLRMDLCDIDHHQCKTNWECWIKCVCKFHCSGVRQRV